MFSVRSLRAGALLIGLVLVVLALAPSLASAQAPTIAITNLALTCSNVNVSYSVSNVPAGETYVLIRVDGPSGQVGATSGSAANGSHSASATFDPSQPENTTLTVTVTLYNAGEPQASDSRTQNCSGGTPPQPPSEPADNSGWPGDGRLNPDRAEYYSVYCAFDQVEVWRSVPAGTLVENISILDLLALDGCTTTNAGLAVCRYGDDVAISGNNGNAAPAAGSKSFKLSQCIERNGGTPAQPAISTNTDSTLDDEAEAADEAFYQCLDRYADESDALSICIEGGLPSSNEILWDILMNCFPSLFIVVGGPTALGYRHHRRLKLSGRPKPE